MEQEPVPQYRLIIREYATAGANPEQRLNMIPTDLLPNGALGFTAAQGLLYRLDKTVSGAGNGNFHFSPLMGPGVWRQVNANYAGLMRFEDVRVVSPVALPAATPTVVLSNTTITYLAADPASVLDLVAAVEIIPGAAPGGTVLCELQRQWAGGAWTTVDARNTLILPATEGAAVPLAAIGDMGRVTGVLGGLNLRILCTATVQACVANNAHLTMKEFLSAA